MEEKPVRTHFLGEELRLTCAQFEQLIPLVTSCTMQEIRLPQRMAGFGLDLGVLNACLYYDRSGS